MSCNIYSQKDSISVARNILYIEAAGIGGYGSINYERIVISKKKWMLNIRSGISTYHIKDYTTTFNPDIIIPFSINGLYGTNHKIELGIGQTLTNIVYADVTAFKPKRKTHIYTTGSIGYRYQKNTGGLFFRCTYTPIIGFNDTFKHWAGVSFGYSF